MIALSVATVVHVMYRLEEKNKRASPDPSDHETKNVSKEEAEEIARIKKVLGREMKAPATNN